MKIISKNSHSVLRASLLFSVAFLLKVPTVNAKDNDGRRATELQTQASQLFYEKQDNAGALKLYRELRDNFPDDAFVRSGDAQFYVGSCLFNLNRFEEAIKEDQAFLSQYPNNASCAYQLFFIGEAYHKLGNAAKAKQTWEELIKKYPTNEIAAAAKESLASPGASDGSAPQSAAGNSGRNSERFPDYQALREKAKKLWTGKNKASETYIILIESNSPLMKAAKMLAKYRKAEIVNFLPANPEGCLEELIKKKARYVTVFVEPKDMDVNLLRKLIVLSTLLDDDPFCDCALGFVTASSTEEVEKFVMRIIEADKNGVKDFAIGINMSNVSVKYEDDSFIKGMSGESYYIAEGDLKYAREALSQLNRAGFIHIGGCADPEGIWLFNDQRNLDESKHWPFDPKKVGWDPKGEMPRITAGEFRNLKLTNAVVWTHACHIGSVGRVFVEGDIVSTFGRCDTVEEYLMPKEKSVALAIIEAGVSAYICPLGPNFGAQAGIEQSIASETGIPLGDVMRRAYHDVVMDTDGHPEKIGIFIKGKPRLWNPDDFTNNNLPQHRCLYGDPLFAPFKDKKSPPAVSITAKEKGDGLSIAFQVKSSGYLGRTWYGNRGENPGQGRIYEEIPLEKNVQGVSIGEVKTRDAFGKEFGIISQMALIEKIDGKTILHIQLVSDNPEALRNAGATIEVSVKYKD